MYCQMDVLLDYGCCGVGVWWDFGNPFSHDSTTTGESDGGIGYSIAGFINSDTCRQAYEDFKARFEIVFQSPIQVNKNSGNEFFFCVYKER